MTTRLITAALALCILTSTGCKTTKNAANNKNTGSTLTPQHQTSEQPSGQQQIGSGKHLNKKNDATPDKGTTPKKASDDATQPAP